MTAAEQLAVHRAAGFGAAMGRGVGGEAVAPPYARAVRAAGRPHNQNALNNLPDPQ